MTRVSDAHETRVLVRHAEGAPGVLDSCSQRHGAEGACQRRGWDLDDDVPVVHRLRGQREPRRRAAEGHGRARSSSEHGGIVASARARASCTTRRSSTRPYIRDFLLDRGAVGDVSETAAPWAKLHAALRRRHGGGERRVRRRSASRAGSCATCRTRTTRVRACTSRSRSTRTSERDALAEYDVVKWAIQQAFVDNGGTLSHHHARRHRARAVAGAGHLGAGCRDARGAVRGHVDPGANFNPGKIVAADPAHRRQPA